MLLTFQLLPTTATANDNARVLYQKGNAAFKEGDDILARHYYEQSLELEESFDARCNLGRAEAVGKLWRKSYFNLGLCLQSYPEDEELAAARNRYANLRESVRAELDESVVSAVDAELAAALLFTEEPADEAAAAQETEVAVEDAASAEGVPMPEAVAPPSLRRNHWKLPTAVSLSVLGATTGLAGAVLLGSSASLKSQTKDFVAEVGPSGCGGKEPAPGCSDNDERLQQSDRRFNSGLALAVVGGGLLVTSLAIFLAVPLEVEVGSLSLRPTASIGNLESGWSGGVLGQF